MTSNIQQTGATVSVEDAEKQSAAIRKIMAEREINYGPAYNIYIKQQKSKEPK